MGSRSRAPSLLAVILIAGCELSVVEAPPDLDPDAVHIGVLVPLSGPSRSFGAETRDATRLAVSEINAAGGVNGRMLQLIFHDTRTNTPEVTSTSIEGVNRLADLGVVAIVGPDASAVVVAVSDTVVARGVPMIATGATSPLVSTLLDNDLIFRTPPSDALQGVVLANVIRGDGHDAIGIVRRDDAYGNGLAATLQGAFEAAGGRVLANVAYPAGKFDGFGAQLDQLYANGAPQAVAVLGLVLDSAGLLRELAARPLAVTPALYGGDGNTGPQMIANTPPEILVGMKGTNPFVARDTAVFAQYEEAHQTVVGKPARGPFSYDAIYLTALALIQAGEHTPAAVQARLRAVSRADSPTPIVVSIGSDEIRKAAQNAAADLDFEGVSGAIDWDAAGDVSSGTYNIQQYTQTEDGIELVVIEVISVP